MELDDVTHERADRRERDAFVDGVLEAAGLPVVRVKAKAGYGEVPVAVKTAERMPNAEWGMGQWIPALRLGGNAAWPVGGRNRTR